MVIRHIRKFLGIERKHIPIKELETIKESVTMSFSNMKNDIEEQKKWINYLYSNHKDLNASHTVLHDKHEHHRKLHGKDVDNLNKWVMHLHEISKKQESAMQDMEEHLSLTFEKYNKYLVDLYKVVAELKTNNEEASVAAQSRPESRLDDQTQYKTSANTQLTELKNDDEAQDTNTQDYHSHSHYGSNNYTDAPVEHYSKVLTRAEKKIIAEMCNNSQKLSYKDIALVSNLSANTVKNHVCHIRNKGFPVKEMTDRNGIKRYYVPDNVRNVLLSKTV